MAIISGIVSSSSMPVILIDGTGFIPLNNLRVSVILGGGDGEGLKSLAESSLFSFL